MPQEQQVTYSQAIKIWMCGWKSDDPTFRMLIRRRGSGGRGETDDIEAYYLPSMMEDPWRLLRQNKQQQRGQPLPSKEAQQQGQPPPSSQAHTGSMGVAEGTSPLKAEVSYLSSCNAWRAPE